MRGMGLQSSPFVVQYFTNARLVGLSCGHNVCVRCECEPCQSQTPGSRFEAMAPGTAHCGVFTNGTLRLLAAPQSPLCALELHTAGLFWVQPG